MLLCKFCNTALEVEIVIADNHSALELYLCPNCGRTRRETVDFHIQTLR